MHDSKTKFSMLKLECEKLLSEKKNLLRAIKWWNRFPIVVGICTLKGTVNLSGQVTLSHWFLICDKFSEYFKLNISFISWTCGFGCIFEKLNRNSEMQRYWCISSRNEEKHIGKLLSGTPEFSLLISETGYVHSIMDKHCRYF